MTSLGKLLRTRPQLENSISGLTEVIAQLEESKNLIQDSPDIETPNKEQNIRDLQLTIDNFVNARASLEAALKILTEE